MQASRLAVDGGEAATEVAAHLVSETTRTLSGEATASFVTWLLIVLALNTGFYRLTQPYSHVQCEMVTHFVFYRVGLQFSLWWTLLGRILIQLITEIPPEIVRYVRKRHASVATTTSAKALARSQQRRQRRTLRLIRKLGTVMLDRAIRPLAETLVAAAGLCAAYWFGCLIYYRIEIFYAARIYLGPFIRDLFGTCARSGFGEIWGMDCIT